jgi:hypothetical protein
VSLINDTFPESAVELKETECSTKVVFAKAFAPNPFPPVIVTIGFET